MPVLRKGRSMIEADTSYPELSPLGKTLVSPGDESKALRVGDSGCTTRGNQLLLKTKT